MTPANKKLRSGYTTGACAAATAKAAAVLLLSSESGVRSPEKIESIEIPFPDGSRVRFKIHDSSLITRGSSLIARASVIKDAGDDPDVTNKAEIRAEAKIARKRVSSEAHKSLTSELPSLRTPELIIKGGKGVGIVTKPGLQMPVGEAAINPVPRRMITEAVMEAIEESTEVGKRGRDEVSNFQTSKLPNFLTIEVTISVPDGERIAKRTLNSRLGITGGISILGTTGIVKPLSSEAWTASITAAMDVAKAMGREEVVLSSGRTSERIHMEKCNLPVESYVMMGDYIEFSLLDAARHRFKKIHLCSQWAKTLKIAMATPQTHVRHGAINMGKTVEFLNSLGIAVPKDREFNTAREIHDLILSAFQSPETAFLKVCAAAGEYAEKITGGIPVTINLVMYDGDIIVNNDRN
ncbi:MAG: cobalt-precorrin-5B (C(1))-methyltransferase CbiD [Nitrospirota bacterium]